MMTYKGYVGKAEFDDEVDIFHGNVLLTRGVVTFQGRTVNELKKAFRDSVDDYIAFCKEQGIAPEKPSLSAPPCLRYHSVILWNFWLYQNA